MPFHLVSFSFFFKQNLEAACVNLSLGGGLLTQFDVHLVSGYDNRGVLVGGGRGSKACVGR